MQIVAPWNPHTWVCEELAAAVELMGGTCPEVFVGENAEAAQFNETKHLLCLVVTQK